METFYQLTQTSFNLNKYRCLVVEGEDAESFLNSQTTNSIIDNDQFKFDSLLDISAKIESFFICLKVNKKLFKLLIPHDVFEETLIRLEKFHICEDVNFFEDYDCYSLHFFSSRRGFCGKFGSLDAIINNDKENLDLPSNVCHILGVPILEETIFLRELINNTLLFDIAVDLKKGCFLGQETVSKIATRRGAAFAPILLKIDSCITTNFPQKIHSLGSSIGEIRASFKLLESYYYVSFINRENRISDRELFIDFEKEKISCRTFCYPFITINSLVDSLYQEAVVDFQLGKTDLAISKFNRIIEVSPSYYDAYESLGVIWGRENNFKQAIEIMHRLEKINPKSVMAQTNLSMFYMKCGEIEKAEQHKSNATLNQFEMYGEEAIKKRALEEERKRKKEDKQKRESMFKQVLQIDPEDALASFGLGEFRLEEGFFEEAIFLLSTALKTDPKYSVAYLALAKAYIASGKKELAISTLKDGISIASKNGDLMPANEMQSILNSKI